MAAKIALITGSTSGIGLGIARRLAQRYDVILTGLTDSKTKENLLRDFKSSYETRCHFVDSNLSSDQGAFQLYDGVMKLYPKGIDVLVNNAGIQHVDLIEDFPEAKWHEMMAIHLSAPFLLTKRFMPHMKKKGWGRVINMASVMGLISVPGKVPYSTAKWGMIGMIKGAALEGAEHGVTCNAVCPGFVETELVNKQVRDYAAELGISYEAAWTEYYRNRHPTRKPVTVEQVAGLVAFLCTDEAASITGTALPIDGGYTAR